MADTDVVPGQSCPECGTKYRFEGNGEGYTRVYGRSYRLRYMLNKVVKCANCGNIHSWNTDIQGVKP